MEWELGPNASYTSSVYRKYLTETAKKSGKEIRNDGDVEAGFAKADKIIEAMPVKSLVTYPKSGIEHKLKNSLSCRGHAWVGDAKVKDVYVSIDFGASWKKATLTNPVNHLAWQHWSLCGIQFPRKGYYEVWSRAVDEHGISQPMILPGWNPKGYLNNACHRIAVQVV